MRKDKMTLEVLQDRGDIDKARKELISKGASGIEPTWRIFSRRIGFGRQIAVGDVLKSWDVLATLHFLEEHVDKNEPILDIGCYASEVIVALHKLCYSRLSGVDLNPRLKRMPYQDSISYETADFMHTKFSDESFQAITSISVIEHGFQAQALLKEMSRLLKPSGYFIASFDYWPEKIDTTGAKFFGMDWLIFSKEDVAAFVKQAAEYGLVPVGEMSYDAKDKAIGCGGKQYTFAWMVLQKMS
jgi:ubiquinone/menaquinone biosynthesis C-methylase UbiE